MNQLPKLLAGRASRSLLQHRFQKLHYSSSTLRFTSNSASHSSSSLSKFLNEISTNLSHLEINQNKYDLHVHGKGEGYHPTSPPAAILTPTSVTDVSSILKYCNEYKIPVIPYGAGTSVEGHVAAIYPSSISLDMQKFKQVDLPTDGTMLEDAHIQVGAGVTRHELNQALRHTGLEFKVDPGADATIGGMTATSASGTTAVCYGTMRENILGLECVLPDGTVANCGSLALKSSSGYDLTSLMCGSEGTLGVITKVTVKLHPVAEHVSAAICEFDTLHEAALAISTMKFSSIPLERCELLDESSLDAFHKYTIMSEGNVTKESNVEEVVRKPTVFLEFTGATKDIVQEHVKLTELICNEFGGSNFEFKTDEIERRKLWSARHDLYYASLAMRKGAEKAIITDACVPLSKLPDLISATAQDVKDYGVIATTFGHAGDGNFHCILPILEDDDEEYIKKLHEINENLIKRTLEVGGTCTGEHGIGNGKIKYLKQMYGGGGVKFMQMIKKGLDVNNIMNPGKIVDI